MRIGVIARADDTGIGNQTFEFYRHMKPDKVLVVDMKTAIRRTLVTHPEWYPGATTVSFDGFNMDETVCRQWLADLAGGVVYCVETPYLWAFCDWARDANVRTVCHLNPEFYKHPQNPTWPEPDVWWLPTVWREEHMPAHRVVPVPVALDRFDYVPRPSGTAVRFLHVVGRQAWGDRAGTATLLRALRHCQENVHLTMVTQDNRLPVSRGGRRNVKLSLLVRSRVPYWELYGRGDVLVFPRRYGGLSLVANEAAAAGLALVMPDTCPHPQTWPGLHLASAPHRLILNSGHGPIPVHDVDTVELGRTIDELAGDPDRVRALSEESRAWAEKRSWAAMEPMYREELELAAAAPMRA